MSKNSIIFHDPFNSTFFIDPNATAIDVVKGLEAAGVFDAKCTIEYPSQKQKEKAPAPNCIMFDKDYDQNSTLYLSPSAEKLLQYLYDEDALDTERYEWIFLSKEEKADKVF